MHIKEMKCVRSYKSVALRSAGVLVSDDHGLQDLPKLLKILPHGLLLGFPCQSTYKHFGVGCVSKLPHNTWWIHDTTSFTSATNLTPRINSKTSKLSEWLGLVLVRGWWKGRERREGGRGGGKLKVTGKKMWGRETKGGYRAAIYTSVCSLHPPCSFAQCHAHIKIPHREAHPPPQIFSKMTQWPLS
jgi:hypothetical protein